MEDSLYTGALSQAAQKILTALRAQSLHEARYNQNSSNSHRQMERSDNIHSDSLKQARGDWSHVSPTSSTSHHQSSITQQSSQTSASYQYSQTPHSSLSSQAFSSSSSSSSSCWDSSIQSQTETYYQCSQTYSHRECFKPPAYQSSHALSFSLQKVPKTTESFCHIDRCTVSVQRPERLSEHQAKPWRNSTEQIRPSFILSDKEDPDEVLFPAAEQPISQKEEPAVVCHPLSSYPQACEKTDNNTSGVQKENVSIDSRDLDDRGVPSGSPSVWKQPVSEVATSGGGGNRDIAKLCETIYLPPSRFAARREKYYNADSPTTTIVMEKRVVLEHVSVAQIPNLGQEIIMEGSMLNRKESNSTKKSPATSEREVSHTEKLHDKGQTVTETTEKSHSHSPLMQCLIQSTNSTDNLETTNEVKVRADPETKSRKKTSTGSDADQNMEAGQMNFSDMQPRKRQYKGSDGEGTEVSGANTEEEERGENQEVPHVGREDESKSTVESAVGRCPTSTLTHEGNNTQKFSCVQDLTSAATAPNITLDNRILATSQSQSHHHHHPQARLLKRKHELTRHQNTNPPPKICLTWRPPKWKPPYISQKKAAEAGLKTSELDQEPQSEACPATKEPRSSHDGSETCVEFQTQCRAGSVTTALTSDPRVKDSGKLSLDEKMQLLEKAGQAKVLVITMVYRDGTTQLDPEPKLVPPVCGLLVLMKDDLNCSTVEDSLRPNDSLVYLKLEHTPAWAQQQTHQSQELFTRDMLLKILSQSELVLCYKAKDFLRTTLQFYRQDLSWKQVAGCKIQDPQVSGWLLDPADPSSSFQDLLNKHCKQPHTTPALGPHKVSQVISSLYWLYGLNMKLCFKLQSQGLWKLYSDMELNMIPVLAAMESHRIHVDKDALRRTSDLLGTKLKQLEQEAHRAAGQKFLVTSSTQLRTVLFEKLRLHEHCENKKLPKTLNKQQQSTSEAALLQLQELHPLPKIILEYRQVHKIKSTFVDGILSCMMSKNYISSTWHQTSAVTGRISAKHPNFQALPRQPLQITKKQHIQGKEEEMVTVHPRAMFVPQEGRTFLSADFCQVELRLLAHFSSDPELLRIFTNPQADVFTMLASQWKGLSESEVTSEDREHAKRIVYSVVYGAGRERLSGILGVTSEQASRFQDDFLQTYRDVQAFIQKTIQQSHKQGYVLSIMGRRRSLPNIKSPDWGLRMQAERQAVNFVVQGSAADLCKMAMIRIFTLVSSSTSLSARLVAQLHDELLFEVEDTQVEMFAALVRTTMESLQHIDQLGVHLKVPLKVAVSSGKSWGSMSELIIPPTTTPVK